MQCTVYTVFPQAKPELLLKQTHSSTCTIDGNVEFVHSQYSCTLLTIVIILG